MSIMGFHNYPERRDLFISQYRIGSHLTPIKSCDVTDNKTNDSYILRRKIYVMNDIFHREDERLKTFDNWPLEWMDKCLLAQTGVFYTGEEDKVKCYFCEVEIGHWEFTDHPVSEHLRWSPNCPLLRRRTTNNVPISAEALDQVLPAISYDICGANDAIEVRHDAYAEGTISAVPRMMISNALNTSQNSTIQQQYNRVTNPIVTSPPETGHELFIIPNSSNRSGTYFPEYPEYAIESARVRSFSEWPCHLKQTPEQLAEAGFFYTGVGDRVKCFSCGGGLKDWDDTDDPWEQHALWLEKCRYLKLMKGENYIDAVLAKSKEAKEASGSSSGKEAAKPPTDVAGAIAPVSIEVGANAVKLQQTSSTALTTGVVAVNADTVTATGTATTTATATKSTHGVSVATETVPEITLLPNVVEKKTNNTSIPEEKLCKICYAAEYNTTFLPCGHVVACAKCASSVTKCPLCRKPFTDVMRVYFS